MKKLPFVCIVLFTLSCKNVSTEVKKEDVNTTFNALLQEALDDSFNQVAGVSMSVYAPDLDIDFQGAVGFDSKQKENKLQADQPFRIASITKPFVASAILRLHEMDSLDIEHPIDKYISEAHKQLLTDGGYNPNNITIKQCLQHTSGLFDYAVGSNTYVEMVLKNPQRKWSRTDQIKLAMDIGKPYGRPSESYNYSDTGYILLGEIIETVTQQNLGQSLKGLLKYETNTLNTTWFETFESNQNENKAFVNRYLEGHNATEWNASIDLYGGGGLISTTKDLSRFGHHLFNGNIYDKTETLGLMLKAPDVKRPSRNVYHCGLQSVSIYGKKAYMHNGLWGTLLVHIPEYNCTVAINYTNKYYERLLKKVVLVIKNLKENA